MPQYLSETTSQHKETDFVSRDDPTDAKLKAMHNCQQKKMKNCRIYMVEKSLAP